MNHSGMRVGRVPRNRAVFQLVARWQYYLHYAEMENEKIRKIHQHKILKQVLVKGALISVGLCIFGHG